MDYRPEDDILTSEDIERFFAKCRPDESGCILWTGCVDADGYGRFTKRRNYIIGAHRVAKWIAVGRKLHPSEVVMHTCDIRRCVNDDHLVIGTHSDNAKDRHAKGRTWRKGR